VKITLLPPTYYSDPTYHRVLSSLRREFLAAGHAVEVISRTTTKARPLQLRVVPDAAPPGPAARSGAAAKGGVVNFHFSGGLRAWHSRLLLQGPLAAERLVVTFQDYRHPDLPPVTAASRRALLPVLRKAHRITAVSSFLARLIKADFPSMAAKVAVIPNGADLPEKNAGAVKGAYILSVGREAPYKGLDLLLFSFAKAVEKGCEADLVVCGTGARGPLGRLARKLGLEKRVKFTGVIAPARVAALMRGCLFFATTPRWESFGMAALEAMAAGKAVMASNTGGLAGLSRGGRALLVPPGDVDAAASAILRLSGSAALRKSLGRKAAAAASRYSWEAAAKRYLAAYR
jgi:glycosyltransferase involved in cell wall biosynthesis